MLFFIICTIFAITIYIWQKHNYNYWRKRNVRYIKPTPFVGNFGEICQLKNSFGMQMYSLYTRKGYENDKVVGIYSLLRPALLVKDVNLVKKIMIKDFNNFQNRVLSADPHNDPLASNNLFFIQTPYWRELRQKLSPVFSSGKIKQMYPLMVEIAQELDTYLKTQSNGSVVEVKDLCRRYTTEVIGSIAFGIRSNILYNPKSEFYVRSCQILELTWDRAFAFFAVFAAPKLARLFRTTVFSKSTSNFMRRSISHVMNVRENNSVTRNDLIDILIDMKRDAAADPRETHPSKNFDYLVAQAMIFQTAGFETSSSTMSFALYEMTKQPHIQKRLREEIAEYMKSNGDSISYEKIQEMPYLSMVVDETLRMYPILPFLDREYTPEDGKNYNLHDDITLTPGTAVYVSISGIHLDPNHWPEPHIFDPERFSPENRSKINKDAYMPFGHGPRNCIGMRLGLLQTKLGLVHFLRDHELVFCDQTPKDIDFCPKSPALTHKTGLYMKLKRN